MIIRLILNSAKYFRWLSMDVVLGAIFFLYFLDLQYQADLSWVVYLSLGCSVWLIYLLDHWLDSRKKDSFFSIRHQFYKHNNGLLRVLVIFSGLLGLVSMFYLPSPILFWGSLLLLFSTIYLLLVMRVDGIWVKELMVAFGYAIGVYLAPLAMIGWSSFDLIKVAGLFLVALINLLVFSLFEYDSDRRDGFGSLVRRLGPKRAVLLITILLIVTSLCSILIAWFDPKTSVLYLCMTAVLSMITAKPKFFRINERYRIVGDAIFYLPFLFTF